MENETHKTNCNACGRPFPKAEPECGCAYKPCHKCNGYAPGCIKKGADRCKSCCVIPCVTVETMDGLIDLANCLVHVISTNTTFYVDDKHSPMIVWTGAVEIDEYDIIENPLKLRAQDCYTTIDGEYTLVRFDRQGIGHIIATEENQNGM